MTTRSNSFAWSARCDCRNAHASSSGRCNSRDVTDPTRTPADNFAACERCRKECPCGSGKMQGQDLLTLAQLQQLKDAYAPFTVFPAKLHPRLCRMLDSLSPANLDLVIAAGIKFVSNVATNTRNLRNS